MKVIGPGVKGQGSGVSGECPGEVSGLQSWEFQRESGCESGPKVRVCHRIRENEGTEVISPSQRQGWSMERGEKLLGVVSKGP